MYAIDLVGPIFQNYKTLMGDSYFQMANSCLHSKNNALILYIVIWMQLVLQRIILI